MARPTLTSHPKFAKLATYLKGRALARGVLELLWESCYASGDPCVGDAVSVEGIADWRGKRGDLASALVDAGFLDQTMTDGGRASYLVHDLEDHAPDYVLARWAREAKRREKGQTLRSVRQAAAAEMWKQKRASDGQLHASDEHGQATVAPPAPAPAPAPAPRSDRKSVEDREVVGGEVASRPSPPPPLPAIMFFSCDPGRKARPTQWPLTQREVDQLHEAFPSLDIVATAKRAKVWIEANREHRKTYDGMLEFLRRWLERDLRNGGPRAAGSRGSQNVEHATEWLEKQQVRSGG